MLSRWARHLRYRGQAVVGLLLLVPVCAQGAEIRGRILPVPGLDWRAVRIDLIEIPDDYRAAVMELRGEYPPIEATATLDVAGRFRIETTARGIFVVEVRARGFLPMSHRLLPLVDTTELPDLRPLPAKRATLQVVDRSGDGIEAAGVRYQPMLRGRALFGGRTRQWRPATQRLSTDRHGRARLWRTAGAFQDRLWAGAPGYVPAFHSDGSMPQRLQIENRRGRRRLLRMVDTDGQPLASVIATDQRGFARGMSDRNGRLRLRLQPEELLTFIGPEGRRRIWALPDEPAPVEAPPAPPRYPPIDVELTARRVAGRVDSAGQAGEAVAGAWVGLFDGVTHTYPLGTAVRTDDLGRYDLVVFGDWTKRIHARAAGFLPATASWSPEGPDKTTGPDISLLPAALASGRVVSDAGDPIAEARITIRPHSEGRPRVPGSREESRTTSEDDGSFELLDLRPGWVYVGSVTAPGLASARFELAIDDSGQSEPVEVVLDLGLAVSGRVVDDGGSPVDQALVLLLPSREGRLGPWQEQVGALAESREATADEAGRFRVEHLRAGRYDVVAQAPGYAPASRYRFEVLEDDLELDDLELSPAMSLEGRVIDTRGRGIEDARIYVGRRDEAVLRSFRHQRAALQPGNLQPGTGPEAALRTDEKGLFSIDDLGAGQRLDLDLQHPDYARLRVPGVVVPTAEPLVLELERKATLAGTVSEADGSAADIDLRLERGPSAGHLQLVRVSDGRFRIEGLRSGAYHFAACEKCTVEPPSIILEEAEVVVDLDLVVYREEPEILRTASVRGRLLDSSGIGVEGMVWVSLVGSGASRGTPSDSGGAYRLHETPVGLTEFKAARRGGAHSLIRTVDLREGDNEVDLVLRGFELSGKVLGQNDRPIPAARVQLGGWFTSALTDSGGRFSIRDVVSGVHELLVTHPDWIDSAPQKVRVDSDRDDLEIRLRRGAVIRGRIAGLPQADLALLEITAHGRGYVRGQVVGKGYEIRGVAPGDWRVSAEVANGGRQASATTRVSGSGRDIDLDLEFGSGWLVAGTVLHNQRGLADHLVAIVGGDAGQSVMTLTDYRGAFAFLDLPSGEWQLTIVGETGGVLFRETFTVESDVDLGAIEIE